MKVIFTLLTLLFLLYPVIADGDRPKFRFMETTDIVLWYEIAIAQSVLENAEHMRFLSLLAISQEIPCFDVVISTKSDQHWDIYSPPTWYLTGKNCVDKRIYDCGGNDGK